MPDFENTALIIGAGAHVPYEMPTGMQLTNDIIDLVRRADETVNKGVLYHSNPHSRLKQEIISTMVELQILDDSAQGRSAWEVAQNTLIQFVNAFARSQQYSLTVILVNHAVKLIPTSENFSFRI